MFLNYSYFLMFLNNGLVARIKQYITKKYVFAIVSSSERLETVNTASAKVASLLIIIPAPRR